jgi:hypothetical protein
LDADPSDFGSVKLTTQRTTRRVDLYQTFSSGLRTLTTPIYETPASRILSSASATYTQLRYLRGVTTHEIELAEEALTAALAKSPVGTPRRTLEQVRDHVASRVQKQVSERQQKDQQERSRQEEIRKRQEEAESRKRAEASKLCDAERRVDYRLSHVDDSPCELEHDIKFDSVAERLEIGKKLQERIRPILIQQLLRTPEISDEKIHQRIDVLVDRYIGPYIEE